MYRALRTGSFPAGVFRPQLVGLCILIALRRLDDGDGDGEGGQSDCNDLSLSCRDRCFAPQNSILPHLLPHVR